LNFFNFSNHKSPHGDFSSRKDITERTYSTNSSNESDIKPEMPSNIPNMFAVSCTVSTMALSSLINTPGQSSYPLNDPFDYNSLAKQYHSASNLLQNMSKTGYFDSSTGKYAENSTAGSNNNNNSPTGKYFENKYFPGSQSDFSSIIGRNTSTSSNYSFGQSNILQSGFSVSQSISSKPFSQFSGSGYLPITSSYPALGSNPGSSFNAPCFNTKFGTTESLNNNYFYPPNLFSSSVKPPTYSTSQGSTQIFPSPFGSNGIFPPSGVNSSLISSDGQESSTNGSSYNQSGGMVGNNNGGSQVSSTGKNRFLNTLFMENLASSCQN